MGYSCRRESGFMLDLITSHCVKTTGSSNCFVQNDKKYFYQIGKENRDGAITGTIWKFLEDGKAKKTGSFRIEPDGKVSLGPKFFKNIKLLKVKVESILEVWRPEFGPPNEENLFKFVQDFLNSFKKNGANQHIGEIYNPTHATIYDVDDNIVTFWKKNDSRK